MLIGHVAYRAFVYGGVVRCSSMTSITLREPVLLTSFLAKRGKRGKEYR